MVISNFQMRTKYHIQELNIQVLVFLTHDKGMELITRRYCHPAELGLFFKSSISMTVSLWVFIFCWQIYLFTFNDTSQESSFLKEVAFMVEEEGWGCH